MLDKAIGTHGKPQSIRCDNGPEITSRHFLAWAIERRIDVVHIRPGKPTENAYVESFHGRLRDECLNTSWFWNLFDDFATVRDLIQLRNAEGSSQDEPCIAVTSILLPKDRDWGRFTFNPKRALRRYV